MCESSPPSCLEFTSKTVTIISCCTIGMHLNKFVSLNYAASLNLQVMTAQP